MKCEVCPVAVGPIFLTVVLNGIVKEHSKHKIYTLFTIIIVPENSLNLI